MAGASSTGKKAGGGTMKETIVCSLGIFFFYFWFSIAQHDIYKVQEDGTKFGHTSLQLFVMILVNCIGALVANRVLTPLMRTDPSMSNSPPVFSLSQATNPYSWLSIGLAFYGAMDASNRSLKSLSYPIMVLGKSCKMVPVMFAGILINKTKYTVYKFISVFVVTTGIVIVNFYKGGGGKTGGKDKQTELFPLCLLLLSLVLDAMVGPRQEHHRNTSKAKGKPMSPWESMFKTNLAGVVWAGIACYFTGGFTDGVTYIIEHPEIWQPFGAFAICSVLGQIFIFYAVVMLGSLTCTTICTTRKFFTIVYTATVKGNPLSQEQWIGASLVMGGLVFNMVMPSKVKEKKVKDGE